MAKSGRKRKKADKAKVQLKKSLKLPKGLNNTDSRVTTKKISLVTQLGTSSQDVGGPVTKKKIGLKDLLSKMTSLSTSVRVDGLEGLMELMKSDCQILIEDHLSSLLNKIAPMTTDRERKIRKLAATIFSTFIKKVDPLQMEPMFPLISAHLSCGLSHIDTSIQRDSLKVLDEIIEALPELVRLNFDTILPNCLNQISTQKASVGVASSDKARSFSTNIDEKISSLQWRKEVLQRVQKIFEIIIRKDANLTNETEKFLRKSLDDFYMSVYEENVQCIDQTDMITTEELYKNYFSGTLENRQKENLTTRGEKYIEAVVPLLLDTWTEAVLSSEGAQKASKWKSDGDAKQKLISPEIVEILLAVVSTLRLVVEHFKGVAVEAEDVKELKQFQKQYEPRIVKQMMENFPFDVVSKKDTKKSSVENPVNLISQVNVGIILVFLEITTETPNASTVESILQYLIDLMETPGNISYVSQTSECLRNLLQVGAIDVDVPSVNLLLSKMIQRNSSNPGLIELLDLLTTENKLRFDSADQWIRTLPELLKMKSASSKHKNIVKKLFKQKNLILLDAMPSDVNYLELMNF